MKILHLTHSYNDGSIYDRSITSKMFAEIEKHFEVFHVFYSNDCFIPEQKYLIQNILPYKSNNLICKILNILYIYYSNLKQINRKQYELIWIKATPGFPTSLLFLYKIFSPKKLFFIQLHTPSVNKSKFRRNIYDYILCLNLKFFEHIGSGGNDVAVIKRFKLTRRKIIPVTVGMPDYEFNEKQFNTMRLVYVGTLDTRDVWKTIEGLSIFLKNYSSVKITYDIIGTGKRNEIERIEKDIIKYNLERIVKYHGSLSFDEVKKVFRKCNIGVSFVPITNYYEEVMVTKTIEYLLTGMPVIATSNGFNRKIIMKSSGVLCEDNPNSFAIALVEMYNNIHTYISFDIRKLYEKYSMEYTIKNHYIPFLEKLIEEQYSNF